MHLLLLAVAVLATETVAKCAADDCLRAVQKAPSSLGKDDCGSFMRVTVTPETSTIFTTAAATSVGATTRTTTETIASVPEPSKRWLQQHEVVELLMGRAIDSTIQPATPVTVQATSVPGYAVACASTAAYTSACSCLGIAPTTITEATPSTTQAVRIIVTTTSTAALTTYPTASHSNGSSLFSNSTSFKFSNMTTGHLNETNTKANTSPSFPSVSSGLASNGDKYRLKKPSVTKPPSNTEAGVNMALGTASGLSIPIGVSSMIGYSNTTTSATKHQDTASIKGALDATGQVVPSPSRTNPTSFLNAAGNRVLNGTSPAAARNATSTALFSNSTTSALAAAPFLNSTSSRISNTTATPTPDRPCSSTTSPFAVRVSQPGGAFDGWYLQLSGDGVIFNPAPSSPSRFGVGAGYLCVDVDDGGGAVAVAVAVAVAENGTETGSGVWFVDEGVLEGIEGRGYGALRCSAEGSGGNLACEEGAKRFWVGCGLGLDITSEGGGTAVVDGWNCTGVALETVYL